MVVDAGTKLPLADAVVRCNNERIITDSEGAFSLTTSQLTNIDSIEVSYIGYQNRKVKINSRDWDHKLIIELTPKTNNLNEVVVSSGIEKLIRKCVDKIPANYPADAVVFDGILYLNFRTEKINPIAYKRTAIDAAIETVYPNYRNNNHLPMVYLKENRIKSEISVAKLRDSSRYIKNWYLPNDIIYNRDLFLEKKFIKNYTYQLQGKYEWQGRMVFDVTFKSRQANKVNGFVLIDTATYAFVYFDYWLHDVKELFFKTIKQSHQRISYMLLNGKWYLDRAEISNDYKLEHGQTTSHAAKLYKTLQIKSKKDSMLSSNDLINLDDEVRNYTKYVSNSNWAKYDSSLKMLKASGSDSLLIDIKDSAPNSVGNNNRFTGITQKKGNSIITKLLSYDVGLSITKLPIAFSGYQPGIRKKISPISEYDTKIAAIWKLYKNDFFEIDASNNLGIGGMKASQYELFLGQTISLSKTQRLSPVFGYSHISLKDKNSGQKANDGYINFGIRYLPKLTQHLSLLFEGDYAKQLTQSHSLINIQNKGYSISVGILLNRFN